ncbi:MAG: low-complexity protein [Nostoc sp. GBBB01]|nr:low-complexity protein [Nostoc sp. GBBB01]
MIEIQKLSSWLRNWIKANQLKAVVQHHPVKALSIFGIFIIIVLIWVPQWQAKDISDRKDRAAIENAARVTLVQAFGGLFFFVTAYFSSQNLKVTQENLKVTQEKQVTERFGKAIEQLGNENIHVRLGAVYALERIAKDSDKDYWQVIEILTAYVREKAPYSRIEKTENVHQKDNLPPAIDEQKDIPSIGIDIKAILTVISRRAKSYGQGEEYPLDFSKSDLRGVDLKANLLFAFEEKAKLRKAFSTEADFKDFATKSKLRRANLTGANLTEANLTKANLRGANLVGADLREANLRTVYLTGANLTKANLTKANLTKAELKVGNLTKADLTGANLTEADLRGVNLTEANLWGANLTKADLRGVDLRGANLWGANLTKANLRGVDLRGANLTEADLTEADLTEADKIQVSNRFLMLPLLDKFIEADLMEASTKFKLEKTKLIDAVLEEAYLRTSKPENTNLTEVDVIKAVLLERLAEDVQRKTNVTEDVQRKTNVTEAANLTPEQVRQAKNWKKAKYSEEFRAKLG